MSGAAIVRVGGGRAARAGVLPLALAFAVLAGGLVAGLGLARAPEAARVGVLLPAVTAVATAAALVLLRPVGTSAGSRRVIAAALVVWAGGQSWVAVGNGWPDFPTPGDVVSIAAVPVALLGVLLMLRDRSGSHATWRLGVDGALLGLALALPIWQFGFSRDPGASLLSADHAAGLLVVVAESMVTGVAVLSYLRDLDRDVLLATAGVACFTAGDLVNVHAQLTGAGWPWPAAALSCLGWPLIGVGIVRYRPSARPEVDPWSAGADGRGIRITTAVSLALAALVLVALLLVDAPARSSIGLVALLLAVFGARELVNTRLRGRLLYRLHDEATADPLTGLANRRVLAARMEALPAGERWCLLTVDLDGFKDVNDLLGHAVGDDLLSAVSRRLCEAAPPGALVSRLGGDEFAVLLQGDMEVGNRVGGAIVTAVRQSAADVEGVGRVEVSASVGVAAVNAGGGDDLVIDLRERATVVDPLGALSASGAALRVAKAAGRNRVEVYDEEIARIRQRRLRVEERLRAAVDAEAIDVRFQPIVDLRRGVVSGAEALARWVDPELGRVDPGEFITVAEQTGLVVALGERVLEETLGGGVREGLFDRGLRLSWNVSPVQLRVAGFHRVVQEAIAAHGVPRDQLVMEVTEQVLVEEGQAAQTLHQIAGLGVTIAIDDFGTGYSALGYLHRLPADILKIDQSLTSSLVAEPRSRAITRAVLDMGRTVGLSVVVEGVESGQVDDLVRRMGVGFGQGLYYGQAMTAAELGTMADRLMAGT